MSRVQINEKEVRMGNGILKIQNVDMGLLKDVSIEVKQKQVQLLSITEKFHLAEKYPMWNSKQLLVKSILKISKRFLVANLLLPKLIIQKGLKKRKILTFDDVIRKITKYPLEFFGKDEDGKRFGIRIFQAYAINHINRTFPDDYDMEATFPNEEGKYFEIIDEQMVEA